MTAELARLLPDLPRWVETRAMLLHEQAEMGGFRQDARGVHFIALNRRSRLASIVGEPDAAEVERVLQYADEAISPTDYPLSLAGWRGERAVLHELRGRIPARAVDGAVATLWPADALDARLPVDLREELLIGTVYSPLAVTLFEGRPVAFCYGVSSETLWDVSIDTLEAFRNRGFAALCADVMIDIMAEQGRRPVWGALESNGPSLRLAAKLGFVPEDEITVYSRA